MSYTISNNNIQVECFHCKTTFVRDKRFVTRARKSDRNLFCSLACVGKSQKKRLTVSCLQCAVSFEKSKYLCEKSPNHFCSQSCSATYSNTHKKYGIKRSKLEFWLEQQLTSLYPTLEFHFNRKDAINSELDIYIPAFKLAFELNGLFHYEPIFGPEKLTLTQNNDQRKFQACIEKGISLCVIDVSHQKRFKESTSQPFLKIITDIIQSKTLGD